MSDHCSGPCGSEPLKKNKWLTIAFWLVIFTIVYNIAEGIIAITFGYSAESIALIGFGLDSLIEVSAAGLMLWRLSVQLKRADEEQIEKTETTVHQFVGLTFFALSAYILLESGIALWKHEMPHESVLGIGLALLSLLIMPLLSWGKLKAAKEINSSALRSEAKETIACSLLSLILLVGLAANALFGWWWADPVAGLLMVPWLIKEGTAGLKGEGCCG